ncbi:hypothetical protein [Rhizobium leguminosarum]|uniref:hypothetical protein n=1 Tax=Rhizobium leguminosarum TaxID=384 RepID=UPI003D079F7E
MYIVFFEYDQHVFYFGVTVGGQLTKASKSRDDVARELGSLQYAEWRKSGEAHVEVSLADIPHKQAYVRRSCRFIDGKWTIVDEVNGAMSIFVEMDPVAYYVFLKADYTQVNPVNSPDEGISMVAYHNRAP